MPGARSRVSDAESLSCSAALLARPRLWYRRGRSLLTTTVAVSLVSSCAQLCHAANSAWRDLSRAQRNTRGRMSGAALQCGVEAWGGTVRGMSTTNNLFGNCWGRQSVQLGSPTSKPFKGQANLREVQVLELWEGVGVGHVQVPLHLDVWRQISGPLDVEWNVDSQEVRLLELCPPEPVGPVLDLLMRVAGIRAHALG